MHRDLKPANVKVTPDGKVKVLDFGLAKALTGDASSPDLTHSPTLTAAATQAGVVIGTAAYMSPEQARGKSVDKRADIWAFGAVLYEMLSGRKAFEGETVSDTLAAVLRADIDWAALPRETPPSVRRVLRRCLDRDPKTRFHDIADARIEMDAAPEPSAISAPEAPGADAARAVARGICRASAAGGRRLVDGAAPPAGCRGGCGPLRRDAAGGGSDPLRRHAGPRPVAGREAARVRVGPRRAATALGPRARSHRAEAGRRHRGGVVPVLLSGRAVDRFLRGRQAEEGPDGGTASPPCSPTRRTIAAASGWPTTRSSMRRTTRRGSCGSRPGAESPRP